MFIMRLTAIAIAISASVTVSIGDETSGAFKVMFLVSCDDNLTSSALKSMNPGSKMKSLEHGMWEVINKLNRKVQRNCFAKWNLLQVELNYL